MKYTVQHAYDAYSDGRRLGPWAEGEDVELLESEAEWVNNDSPGTLKPVSASGSAKPAAKKPAAKD